MKYFSHCKNIEDVKETYRKLAKELHPDTGGDAEKFKAMSSEYTETFKRLRNIHRATDQATGKTAQKAAQSNTETFYETPEAFADIINKIIGLDGVEIDIIGSWVWLSGNTWTHRDAIKAAGFWFSSKHKKWYWNGSTKKNKKHSKMKYEEIKQMHGCQHVKNDGYLRIATA